ncbi:unnamed protein product [Arabidopsis lyrata]|uniref:Predicted protein n=1 Tax=Arabidopsis lyrata subsp. lyrata TaxID=81972 RepID=D7KVI9_ARALL|nr:predicted protein [Arabidopsis lyrata subsp. lyrata]CAH8256228.1 unnamed protein product [Arabidopsis lyrata]
MTPSQEERRHHDEAKGSTLDQRKSPGRRRSRADLQTKACSAEEKRDTWTGDESLYHCPAPSTGSGGRGQEKPVTGKPAVAHGEPSTHTTKTKEKTTLQNLQEHM